MSTKEIVVAGVTLSISAPYAAGHAVTEAEARALNTIRAENIGNNIRKAINDAKEKAGGALTPEQIASIQAQVTDYDGKYVFEMRAAASPRVVDPIAKEALQIARALLSKALAENKKTRKEYGEEAYAAKLAEIAVMPDVVAAATKAVKERGKLGGSGVTL